MLKRLTIKRKIYILIFWVATISVLAYTSLSIFFTERIERSMIDSHLYSIALGARHIIGDNYHDDIVDSYSVSNDEYKKVVSALSEFTRETKVKEIYSYINYNGELRFTSSSMDYDQYGKVVVDSFFSGYLDDPKIVESVYFKPFKNEKPLIYSYKDISGSVRSVFIPFKTKNGKSYIVAVDYSSEELDNIISETTYLYLGLGLIILLIGFILSYKPINQISKPLKNLVSYTNELIKNDFHFPEESLKSMFDFSYKSTDEVGKLSEAFLAMQFSLSQYIIDLRNTTIAKESIEGQLKIASAIQLGMIPKTYPTFPDRNEFDIRGYMSPAKEVGGDLFNYFMVDDDHLAFTIGDVSDKGIPAALFMAMTNTLIKAITLSGLSPAEVLYKANNELCKDNEQFMFVTLFLAILNIRTGEVEYANAGHNPFILVQNNNVVEYRNVYPGIVLAAFNDFEFINEQFTLLPNETILMYTDGVTEAMNNNRKLFGEERLLNLIKEKGNLEISNLIDETISGVKIFVDGYEQSDDITVLALRFL